MFVGENRNLIIQILIIIKRFAFEYKPQFDLQFTCINLIHNWRKSTYVDHPKTTEKWVSVWLFTMIARKNVSSIILQVMIVNLNDVSNELFNHRFSNEVREKRRRPSHQQQQQQPVIPGRNRPLPPDTYQPNPKPLIVETSKPETEISESPPKSKSRSRQLKFNNANNNANNNSFGSPPSNLTSKMDDSDSVITAIQQKTHLHHEYAGTQVYSGFIISILTKTEKLCSHEP